MSDQVDIMPILSIEEWCRKARDLYIKSEDELVPMICRMIQLIGIVKDSKANEEAVTIALSVLKDEQDKLYNHDAKKADHLHELLYGLCQCLLQLYSVNGENPPNTVTTPMVLSSSTPSLPTVTTTISPQHDSFTHPSPDASVGGVRERNSGSTEINNEFDEMRISYRNPNLSVTEISQDHMTGSNSQISEIVDMPTYPINSEVHQDVQNLESMEENALSMTDSIPTDTGDATETLGQENNMQRAEVPAPVEINVEQREDVIAHIFPCPICQKRITDPIKLMNHMYNNHTVSFKECGGRIECCNKSFYNPKNLGDHYSSSNCNPALAIAFYTKQNAVGQDDTNDSNTEAGGHTP